MSFRLGVDVGGTFTDVLLMNETNGRVYAVKLASTPVDAAMGVLDGITRVCEAAKIQPNAIRSWQVARGHKRAHITSVSCTRRATAWRRTTSWLTSGTTLLQRWVTRRLGETASAFLREAACRFLADARCRAAHQGRLTFEAHECPSSPSESSPHKRLDDQSPSAAPP
jgi:hypothetical protein